MEQPDGKLVRFRGDGSGVDCRCTSREAADIFLYVFARDFQIQCEIRAGKCISFF